MTGFPGYARVQLGAPNCMGVIDSYCVSSPFVLVRADLPRGHLCPLSWLALDEATRNCPALGFTKGAPLCPVQPGATKWRCPIGPCHGRRFGLLSLVSASGVIPSPLPAPDTHVTRPPPKVDW